METPDPTLRDLLVELLDGTLSESRHQQLSDLLTRDTNARAMYLDYIITHALLRQELQGKDFVDLAPAPATGEGEPSSHDANADFDEEPQPASYRLDPSSRKKPRRITMTGMMWFGGIAAMVLIAVGIAAWWSADRNANQPGALAHVTDSVDAQWSAGAILDGDGSLASGRVELIGGMAELSFADGAAVIVEAPAVVEALSTDRLELHRGRITAHVPVDARGFTVVTSAAEIIDLGTAFGVSVDASGETVVQVFEGVVSVVTAADGRPDTDAPRMLEAGQARRVSRDGSLVKVVDYDDSIFRQTLRTPTADYERWLRQRDHIRTDPDLVAYYTFENEHGSTDKLNNRAATGERLDGRLGDAGNPATRPTWTRGRFPGKDALRFDAKQNQFVRLPSDPALHITGDLSIAWWMKADKTSEDHYSIVVVGCGAPRGGFNHERESDNHCYSHGMTEGRFRAFHESGPGLDQEVLSAEPAVVGQWTHVAIVRDARRKHYSIYVNGELSNTGAYAENATGGDSDQVSVAIGRAGGAELNHYAGLLDELMIFDRQMSASEVRAIYEAGRP